MSQNAPVVDRRAFIGLIGAAAAGFGLTGMAGCSSQSGSSSGDDGASSIAESITYAQDADPTALDPAFFDDGESCKVSCNIYEGLYRYAETDTTVEPCLATELPDISEDGLVYTIPLRDGVMFHDGTPFNAEAAKKSMERQLEPNRTSDMLYASFVYGSAEDGTGVESVEAVDDLTLRITLRAPSTPFLKNLAMMLGAPIVSPTALDAAPNQNITDNPCGTGPYKFESWDPSSSVIISANEDYWDTENMPKTKTVVFRTIPEVNTRVQALINGEVDIIDGITQSDADTLVENGCELFAEDGMTVSYMAFNMTSPICADKDVRRALSQAVNVEELVETIYGEYATVANSVMPLWMAPYAADVKQTSYDPDAARQTLAERGVTSLKCITYTNARQYNSQGGETLANIVQGYFAEVGVQMDIEAYDWATYRTMLGSGDFDICFYGWTGDNGDPDNFMNALSDQSRTMNVGLWQNDEYDELIRQGLSMPDGDDRDKVYLRCEEIVAEEIPWMLISHSKNLCAHSTQVENFRYHPTGAVFMKGVAKRA